MSTWVKYYCIYHREPKRMTLLLFDQKSGGKNVSCFFFLFSLSHIIPVAPFHSTVCVTFGLESGCWHRPRVCSTCWHWQDCDLGTRSCVSHRWAGTNVGTWLCAQPALHSHTRRVNSTTLAPETACGLITFWPHTSTLLLNRQTCRSQEKSK